MKRQNLAVLAALLLLCVGGFSFVMADKGAMPEFTAKSLASGEWMYRFDRMFLRSFPGREALLDVRQELNTLLGQTEQGGILSTERGLIQTLPAPDEDTVNQNIEYIRDFSHRLANAETYLMLVPGKEELYSDLIHDQNLVWEEGELISRVNSELASDVYDVDAATALALHREEYLFYRTDTRWTMTGAYYAFCELASRLRIIDRELDSFDIEYVTDRFYGNLYSEAKYHNIQPDSIGLYHYNYDVRFNKVIYHSGRRREEDTILFRYDYLDSDNPYGVFFGDEYAVFDILTRRQSAKSILFIGDDLANSLVPFLVPSYAKITCVDLQKLSEPLSSAVDLESYDQVVVLESVGRFCQDSGLEKLLT